jgi:hypothetical protein
MTITVNTADPRSIKALALLKSADRWQRGHTKDGRSFFAIPGREPGLPYTVSTSFIPRFDRFADLPRGRCGVAVDRRELLYRPQISQASGAIRGARAGGGSAHTLPG